MATCAEDRLTVSCHWSMWWQAQVPLEKMASDGSSLRSNAKTDAVFNAVVFWVAMIISP